MTAAERQGVRSDHGALRPGHGAGAWWSARARAAGLGGGVGGCAWEGLAVAGQ
jgi:hypothetical protein